MNSIISIIKRLYVLIYSIFFNLFSKKDEKLIVLGSKNHISGELFLHNIKYMFLYLSKNENFKTVLFCDDEKMRSEFQKRGYNNVFARNSIEGKNAIKKAKYWLYDYYSGNVYNVFPFGATTINLWHGVPIKKIGYLDDTFFGSKYSKIRRKLYKFINAQMSDFYITNSDYDKTMFPKAFDEPISKMKTLCSPKLDVLFHDFKDQEIFMEEDFNNIKSFYDAGKIVFIYMPTFRDSGKSAVSWLNNKNLAQFLKQNNAVIVLKLHPFDKNAIDFELAREFYIMNSKSDIYPILKYSNALIADYSSVYFDYLLLDKPIIYFVPDFDEYVKKSRDFYEPYENLISGAKIDNENDLISALKDVIEGQDKYRAERKKLRDKMFLYQDGNNCSRLVEFIESLNKR